MSSNYTATDAAAYERLMGRWSRSLALQLIAFGGIEDGDRILDLGCVADGSFDRCYSQLALNFVPQPIRAVREMLRVTRPGGVIAAAVWDFAGGLTYQRLFWDTAAARDPEAAKARARQYAAALIWPGELDVTFRDAGARDVVGTSLTMRMVYADFADYWEPIAHAQGPVGDYVKPLDPASLAALAGAVESAYLAGRSDGPRSMTATAWAAKGVV